jgi:adenine-specific DNA-methyltransferase
VWRIVAQLHDVPAAQLNKSGSDDDFLERVEFLRLDAARRATTTHKASLGQFFTPLPIARLMVSMLAFPDEEVRILDAGAGVGTLFAACVTALCAREKRPRSIQVTAYELDAALADYLAETVALCQKACDQAGISFCATIRHEDFIASAVDQCSAGLFATATNPDYTCAILNPPYYKINTGSETRKLLRQLGIETSNIYTGFVSAAMRLLRPGAELVAITPRSFCNGPYFRPFREDLLGTMTIDRFHLFESRAQAFQDDAVLQENVIFHAVKGTPRTAESAVVITSSAGPTDEMPMTRTVPFEQLVRPNDPEQFIHLVPDELGRQIAQRMGQLPATLKELGLTVSTGRVVDFRAIDHLRMTPGPDTVPLIYPTHFAANYIAWPKLDARKPNALARTVPADQLVPNEHYVLTKRFSSKEEKRRLVAAVYDAGRLETDQVGFENHLNYYHQDGHGLPLPLARGLAVFLNSTLVDEYFRQFNGHTQVNATDLRSLKYPTRQQLEAMGAQVADTFPNQKLVDALVEAEVFGVAEGQSSDPIQTRRRIEEAQGILRDLGLPRPQQNERSALTLLALLDLKPDTPWAEASAPVIGIHAMLQFFDRYYGKTYAENSRETVRRQTIHQFMDAGIVVDNPEGKLATNSGKYAYQIDRSTLELLRTYGTEVWDHNLRAWLASIETLKARYAQEREMARIPLELAPGEVITLSPGGQNILVEQIINEFVPRFAPGALPIYVGDTDTKFAYFKEERLRALGVELEAHGKMPDVIIHFTKRDWLVLIEAVTSHGPINPKRHNELKQLFGKSSAGLVFVTTFLSRKAMVEYLGDISWETDVWVAESPSHLIHFNGERFLGPYPEHTEPEEE